jgi:integrase
MSIYRSGFAAQIQKFVDYRQASGSWNEGSYGFSLKMFDRFCTESFLPETPLFQEMVNAWCAKRDSELNRSRNTRIRSIRAFIEYLQKRGLTEVVALPLLKNEPKTYIPHAFTHDELINFFAECDGIQPQMKHPASVIRKLTCPVFFRLLYSSGIRTTEARLLHRENVDLEHGILDIQKSKGYDQHYVALHKTMTNLLKRYDDSIEIIRPGRTFFFESAKGTHYSREWVTENFRNLWKKANGADTNAVAYEFRHHYAVTNINSWSEDSFEFNDKLHYLSKSMGHRWTLSTFYYYSIVPRLAETIKIRTEDGFNAIVPEVCYEEE